MTDEKIRIYQRWIVILALAVAVAAVILNRPVKVSVLENVYIEVGEGQAGPPAYYENVFRLEDGRTVYVVEDSCRVE